MITLLAAEAGLLQYAQENAGKLASLTVEHLIYLTVVPVVLAIAIGVPSGILVRSYPWLRTPILGAASVIQTVPSLALLALLQILLQTIGKTPAIIALTLYALLPIVRNTYTGLTGVSKEVLEAARGVGFTNMQRLWMVEIPLALPVIVAGIRTAAVIVVGIATLATLIGAGGLGDVIYQGLQMSNRTEILVGVIAAAALALLTDACIGWIERILRKGRPSG